MTHTFKSSQIGGFVLLGSTLLASLPSYATDREGWSVVPYFGLSLLDDQSPDINGSGDIIDGRLGVAVDSGFSAGLGIRYDYPDSPWTSEIGWEYRSNDADTTTADGISLPPGNYASNTFYLNGRYAITEQNAFTPWVGGGLTWLQEVDLDSENADGERSFSDSGSIGYQLMIGVDYKLSERYYFTSEIRYSSQTGLDLDEESGPGRISGIDYQPVTLGLGFGVRL